MMAADGDESSSFSTETVDEELAPARGDATYGLGQLDPLSVL